MLNSKTHNKKAYLFFCAIFIAIELCILTVFAVTDFTSSQNTAIIKYVSILICFIAAAFQFYFFGRDGALVLIAMLFTAFADLFLVILELFDIGVFIFIFAQLTYFVRICLINSKFCKLSVICRSLAYIAASIILFTLQSFNFLTAVTAFYFINLVANAIQSFLLIPQNKKLVLFSIGLILFIGCDICVGIMNLNWALDVNIPQTAQILASDLCWIFYLPSQVFIVLSANNYN